MRIECERDRTPLITGAPSENQSRLRTHRPHLPELLEEIHGKDRTAQKGPGYRLPPLQSSDPHRCAQAETGNRVHPEICRRPWEKPGQDLQVRQTPPEAPGCRNRSQGSSTSPPRSEKPKKSRTDKRRPGVRNPVERERGTHGGGDFMRRSLASGSRRAALPGSGGGLPQPAPLRDPGLGAFPSTQSHIDRGTFCCTQPAQPAPLAQ